MTTTTEPGIVGLSHVFLSPADVAAMLPGISKNTLSMWRYEGKGPRYRKLGRVVVYALDELEAWIESGLHEGDGRDH